MIRLSKRNEGRLKARHLAVLAGIGARRWAVTALVESLAPGPATVDRVARRRRLVAVIGGLEAMGFAETTAAGKVWLTARGLDLAAGAAKTERRGRKKKGE